MSSGQVQPRGKRTPKAHARSRGVSSQFGTAAQITAGEISRARDPRLRARAREPNLFSDFCRRVATEVMQKQRLRHFAGKIPNSASDFFLLDGANGVSLVRVGVEVFAHQIVAIAPQDPCFILHDIACDRDGPGLQTAAA